jgi:serine phosphatase RsbU (regulator of sigma subunit)/anti-anti-sigma regulatory factor
MSQLRVLVVDDEVEVRLPLEEFFKHRGDECVLAADGLQALDELAKSDFDIMVTDISMPRMDGLELVARTRKAYPHTVCLVLSGTGTRADIISAMKSGAFDFLEKPLPDFATFSMVIDRAAERCRLVRDRDSLLESLKRQNAKLEVSLSQLHEAYGRLRRQEETLETDLRQAQRVQRKMLPSGFPLLGGLDFYAYYAPCERLGGDFFGVVPLGPDKLAVFLGDVAGHGVSAAMITVALRELVHAHRLLHPNSRIFENPEAALKFLNHGLLEEAFDPPILATMAFCVFDDKTGSVVCASAGHPPPLLVNDKGRGRPLKACGPVLGIESPGEFETETLTLSEGDFILFYSDGLSESRNRVGAELTETGLLDLISERHGQTSREVGECLEEKMAEYLAGLTPADDTSFIVASRSTREDRVESRQVNTSGELEDSVKVVLPHEIRRTAPGAPGRVEGATDDERCVIRLSGLGSWRQAPALRDLIQEAMKTRVESIHLDVSDCQALDSTMLGLLYQIAPRIVLGSPSRRVRDQLRELGILNRFTISDSVPPFPLRRMNVGGAVSREDYSDLMISAHESLMGVSDDNRERFSPIVEGIRKSRNQG